MPWHKGTSGNPAGRKKGEPNYRIKNVLETLERLQYSPFEKKVRLAMTLERKIQRNHFATEADKTAYIGLYSDVLKDLLQYTCTKLKSVEHWGQIEIMQKLQSLDTQTDAELHALLEEAEDLARGGE
jgi:hypothetical protein